MGSQLTFEMGEGGRAGISKNVTDRTFLLYIDIYHYLHIIVIIIILICCSFYDRVLESIKLLCQIIDLVILSSQSQRFFVLCFVPEI